jgi:cell division septum initiation protein DivIVA
MNNEEITHIGERTFRKTKLGLAEEEVRAYVEEIISQRDALVKRQEHLSALTELAEKTVMDASNLSQSMMKKTTEQAKAEADKIRIKAEQEGEQLIKTKRAEAKIAADKEAELIKADAQRQAKMVRDEQLNGVRSEAAALAQKLQSELVASIETVKKHALAVSFKIEPVASSNSPAPKPSNNSSAPHAPVMDTSDKSSDTLSAGEKGALLASIPWLEVEVLPPLDIEKIMDLISRLEALPEVKTTDLLPETPNPLIRVFLNEAAPLADILRTLPQVEKVTELTDELEDGDKRERIQIVLGKNPNKNIDAKKGPAVKTN